jgi:hypothetical protein
MRSRQREEPRRLPPSGFLVDMMDEVLDFEQKSVAEIIEVRRSGLTLIPKQIDRRLEFDWTGPDLRRLVSEGERARISFRFDYDLLDGHYSVVETESVRLVAFAETGSLIKSAARTPAPLPVEGSPVGIKFDERCRSAERRAVHDAFLYHRDSPIELPQGGSVQVGNRIATLQRGWSWPHPEQESSTVPQGTDYIRFDMTFIHFKEDC